MTIVGDRNASIYGLAAEFDSEEELILAAKSLRKKGYRQFEVFAPYPIPHMNEAVGLKRSLLGRVVFAGGLTGFFAALALQLIPGEVLYPLLVGGRFTDLSSFTALVPITFEFTILFAALTAFVGLLLMIRLPRWHHPLFQWEEFQKASDDRFFAVIEANDPAFTIERAEAAMHSLGGRNLAVIHEDER